MVYWQDIWVLAGKAIIKHRKYWLKNIYKKTDQFAKCLLCTLLNSPPALPYTALFRSSSPPMVVSWNSSNCPLTKRSTRLDFPTAMSPSSTSLNWQILVCGREPLVRPPLPLVLIVAQVADGTVRTGPPPQRTLGLLVGHCPPKTKLTAVHSWCRQSVISLFCLCKDIKRQILGLYIVIRIIVILILTMNRC